MEFFRVSQVPPSKSEPIDHELCLLPDWRELKKRKLEWRSFRGELRRYRTFQKDPLVSTLTGWELRRPRRLRSEGIRGLMTYSGSDCEIILSMSDGDIMITRSG